MRAYDRNRGRVFPRCRPRCSTRDWIMFATPKAQENVGEEDYILGL